MVVMQYLGKIKYLAIIHTNFYFKKSDKMMERILLHSSTLILIICIMTSQDFRKGFRERQIQTQDLVEIKAYNIFLYYTRFGEDINNIESDGRTYHGEHSIGILGLVE